MDGQIYFTSKYGGRARSGQVYQYDIDLKLLWLIFESPGQKVISGPDNIIMSPRGSLLVCEDRVSLNTAAQRITGLTSAITWKEQHSTVNGRAPLSPQMANGSSSTSITPELRSPLPAPGRKGCSRKILIKKIARKEAPTLAAFRYSLLFENKVKCPVCCW